MTQHEYRRGSATPTAGGHRFDGHDLARRWRGVAGLSGGFRGVRDPVYRGGAREETRRPQAEPLHRVCCAAVLAGRFGETRRGGARGVRETAAAFPGPRWRRPDRRRAGVQGALTSGYDRGLIADIVAHCGWGELFDAVVYPDEVPAGRPAP